MILSSSTLESLVTRFETETDEERIARWITDELEKEQAKLIFNANRGKKEGVIACPVCATVEILEPYFPGCVITPMPNNGRAVIEHMFFKVQWCVPAQETSIADATE
jgi:hypothetical protein